MKQKKQRYSAPRTRVIKMHTQSTLLAASGSSSPMHISIKRTGYGSAIRLD
ncbi:MAG: hypothetical protein K6A98_06580 [Prevotella sp.]|nr:hypothetical protein [Prevotella sp.]